MPITVKDLVIDICEEKNLVLSIGHVREFCFQFFPSDIQLLNLKLNFCHLPQVPLKKAHTFGWVGVGQISGLAQTIGEN